MRSLQLNMWRPSRHGERIGGGGFSVTRLEIVSVLGGRGGDFKLCSLYGTGSI